MCGCKESLFDDQAHSLQHRWRPLCQLQVCTGGRFGKQTGVLWPMDIKELRLELQARGVVIEEKVPRADLQKSLDLECHESQLCFSPIPLSSWHLLTWTGTR